MNTEGNIITHNQQIYLSKISQQQLLIQKIKVNRLALFNNILRKLNNPASFHSQDINMICKLYMEFHRVPHVNLTIISYIIFDFAYRLKGKTLSSGKVLPSFEECCFQGHDIETIKLDFANNFALYLSGIELNFSLLRQKYIQVINCTIQMQNKA